MDSSRDVRLGSAALRLALAALFAAAPRLAIRIEAHGLALDAGAPRTIYTMTHKRDADTFASPPIILGRRGWRALAADVRFVMRADALQSGFFARLVKRPAWLQRALRPFSVGGVLRVAGVCAMDGFHTRPAELWVREALAAEGAALARARVDSLLTPEAVRMIASAASQRPAEVAALPVAALSSWRYAAALQLPTGPGLLMGPARRRAERRLMESARSQLRLMSEWLRAGGSLYMAPEGRFSADGLLNPARAGLRQLIRGASPDARIQPIAIMYDFMTTGRLRMFIDMAPPIEDGALLAGSQLDRRLQAAWLETARFTCTQLATAALVALHVGGGPEKVAAGDVAALVRTTRSLAMALHAIGRHVDGALLSADGARRGVGRYLRYAERHGLARRDGATYTITPGALPTRDDAPAALPGVLPDHAGYPLYPMRYAWNEALEMLAAAGLLPATAVEARATATPYSAGAGS
jgi:hypothetical protein